MENPTRVHVLDQRPIRAIRDWADWKAAWERAVTGAELDGLLHVGLRVALGIHDETRIRHSQTNDYAERWNLERLERASVTDVMTEALCFYLDTADRGDHYKTDADRERQDLSWARSLKARQVLTNYYFKGLVEGSSLWERAFYRTEVFEKTLWFCRLESLQQPSPFINNLQNIPTHERLEYHEKILNQLPRALSRLVIHVGSAANVWVRKPYHREEITVTASQFEKAVPEIVHMLYITGGLGTLYLHSLRAEYITSEMEQKLEELAKQPRWDPNFRKIGRWVPVSLEEALLEDNPAAHCLTVLQLSCKPSVKRSRNNRKRSERGETRNRHGSGSPFFIFKFL
jgi:hypothetical protein